jgi:hypothetical protein
VGGWSNRSPDEAKRRTFTHFRSAVNKAINPHEVDHIEFITKHDYRAHEPWLKESSPEAVRRAMLEVRRWQEGWKISTEG